jgi:hypothetical protein
MLPRIVDITTITNKSVVGPPTSWQTPNGPLKIQTRVAFGGHPHPF